MTEEEYNMLNNILCNIVQKIVPVVENKIAENVQALNVDVSNKADNLVDSTKQLVSSVSECSFEKRNPLNNNVCEIRERIKEIRHNQNGIKEQRTNFAKVQ